MQLQNSKLTTLNKQLAKIETEFSKCRGSVMADGGKLNVKKMRKWNYYAQKKMKLIGQINELEHLESILDTDPFIKRSVKPTHRLWSG